MLMSTHVRGHECLEDTALLALDIAQLLMETGASARHVEEITSRVVFGFGADRVDLRVGYASLAITLAIGPDWITRMRNVGALGVKQRLYHALHTLASRIERGNFTVSEARAELDHLLQDSQGHPDWVVAVSVGIACAAFGRLLNVDWPAVGPIFFAAAFAQMVRRQLALRKVNGFISAALVAFLGSVLSGLGARWAGSQTIAGDMVAPVLLLVPGVPCFNAQLDIIEGRPTLGSARAVWVAIMLVFMTVGVWFAQGVLGEGR